MSARPAGMTYDGRMRSGLVLFGVAVFLAACSTTAPAAKPVDPAPSLYVPPLGSNAPTAQPSPAPRPLQADLPNARSWLEPEVIDRLALDCHWTPKELDGGESETRNPMSCRLAYIQSCAPDPCFSEIEDECKPECTKTCGGCTAKCTSSCETCKSACHDDACRHDCAATCAKCRDDCIKEVDKCQSSVCGGRYATCGKETDAALKRPACRAACSAVQRCNQKCSELTDSDPCVESCKKKFNASCMEKLFWYCAMGGRP